jgi:hypothetical protein
MKDGDRYVTIHLSRLGKPGRSFQEGFVDDNGKRLRTFSGVPESVSVHLSEKFHQEGLIPPREWIGSVSKYHFYDEFFSIVKFQDREHTLLGYYCDIVTPLQRNGDEYFLTDLILDLWIFPDLQAIELDRDEFETTVTAGLFPSVLHEVAWTTIGRLKAEIAQGIFPISYLD